MSLVNCVTVGRVGYMIADTAVYLPNLEILRFEDKIATMDSQQMLVSTRGDARLHPRLARSIAIRFSSFDAFAVEAIPFLKAFDDAHPLLEDRFRPIGSVGAESIIHV